MTNADRRLAADTTGQLGSFTRDQAHQAGLTDLQLRRRVQSGFLDQTGPHAFRYPNSDHNALAELTALVRDVGEPCWVSGPTAAALHQLDGFTLQPPFHLTLLRGRDVSRRAHIVHTTIELPIIDRCRLGDLPATRAARTLVDLAKDTEATRLTRAVDAALRDGLVSERSLHDRIVALRGKGRYGLPRLLDVIAGSEVERGGHSWLERETLRLLAEAAMPRPTCQQVLARTGKRLVRVDFKFPGTPVVVEVLGYRFHRSKAEMQRDAERTNALVLAGHVVLQFTYEDVVARPAHVVATIRTALSASVSANSATDALFADTERVGHRVAGGSTSMPHRSVSDKSATHALFADTEPGRTGLKAWWADRPSARGRQSS